MNPFRATPVPRSAARPGRYRQGLSLSLEQAPAPLRSVIGSLTSLARLAHPAGLTNPINYPLDQSSASSHSPSFPPDNEITPASSSILPHAHISRRPNVRPPSSIIHSRPDCLRRLQRSHSADAVPVHSLLRSSCLYSSRLAMASRLDKNSGVSLVNGLDTSMCRW